MNNIVILPTFYRPEGLLRALQTLRDTAPAVHTVVVAELEDDEAQVIAESFGVFFIQCKLRQRGGVPAWNLGLETKPNYGGYVLGSDDCYYLPGWYEALLKSIDENGGSGLFSLNDNTATSHYLMTRDFIVKHHGGVMAVPHYTGWYLDWEACERARSAGKYFFAEQAKIVHDWNGSAFRVKCKKDARIFKMRRENGFPNDFAPIINMEFTNA